MGSLVRCCIQYCCPASPSNDDDHHDHDEHDDDDDDPDNHSIAARRQSYSSVSECVHPIEGQGFITSRHRGEPSRHTTVAASHESSATLASTVAPSTANDDDDDDDNEEEDLTHGNRSTTCCRPRSSDASNTTSSTSLLDVLRHQIMNRWHQHQHPSEYYHAVVAVPGNVDHDAIPQRYHAKDPGQQHASSPLRTAVSFTSAATDQNSQCCTISADEIVLPGSLLQQQMAQQQQMMMLPSGSTMTTTPGRPHLMVVDDECVICMEPFDPTNPRMPTNCHCGTNQTYFHLPCLYQWIEQSDKCPSCRTTIAWKEF